MEKKDKTFFIMIIQISKDKSLQFDANLEKKIIRTFEKQ